MAGEVIEGRKQAESKQHHQQYLDWLKSKHADVGVSCWTCPSVHDREVTERFALKKAGDGLAWMVTKPRLRPDKKHCTASMILGVA